MMDDQGHDLPNLDEMDEDEQAKEIYARAGLAFYFAQVFEQGLIHTLYAGQVTDGTLALEFSSADEFHGVLDRLTAGQIVKRLRAHVPIEPDFDQLLTEALEKRNFLIHRFFSERSDLFFHIEGRRLMLQELHGATKLFRRADARLEALMFEHGSRFGLTRELTQQVFEAMLQEAKPGGRPSSEVAEEIMKSADFPGR